MLVTTLHLRGKYLNGRLNAFSFKYCKLQSTCLNLGVMNIIKLWITQNDPQHIIIKYCDASS
jgi:hypothetical protein